MHLIPVMGHWPRSRPRPLVQFLRHQHRHWQLLVPMARVACAISLELAAGSWPSSPAVLVVFPQQ